jgi:imidazolonepropionase-like amidohydrolase
MSASFPLIAATYNAARILGAEASIGTIEKGKLADIVLLDANPLDDIRNTRKIWMLIKGGRIIDREAILGMSQ